MRPFLGLLAAAVLSPLALAQGPYLTGDEELLNPNPAAIGEFGLVTAMTDEWLAVSHPRYGMSGSNASRVELYRRTPAGGFDWETSILTPAGGSFDDFSTALDLDGDRLIVGARSEFSNGLLNSGSAYIFEVDAGGQWNQIANLTPSIETTWTFFGSEVAISGGTAVVGSPRADLLGIDSGGVFVFLEQPDGSWVEDQVLVGSGVASLHRFGTAITLEGDELLLGNEAGAGSVTGRGEVYVYRRSAGGQFAEVQVLVADSTTDFGDRIDLQGDRLLVADPLKSNVFITEPGVAGPVYVFERQADGSYIEVAMVPSVSGYNTGGNGLSQVVLAGDRFVSSTTTDYLSGIYGGIVYVVERQVSGLWEVTRELRVARDDAVDIAAELGRGLAFAGDVVVAGAPYGWIDIPNSISGGSVHVFELEPLMAGPQSISLSAGGSQDYVLDAGEENAGRLHFLLGSFAGTDPGVDLGLPGVLPLNFDAYLIASTQLKAPVAPSALGALDADGMAQLSLNLPAGLAPQLAGLTAHHAFIAIEPVGPQTVFISNAVPLQLLP